MQTKAKSESPAIYAVDSTSVREEEDRVIEKALSILNGRIKKPDAMMNNPEIAANYLRLTIGGLEHEVFHVLFMNDHHSVLASETMFTGTINETAVYVREIVKRALYHNAASLILAHNHPSGISSPSKSDIQLTKRVKDAMELINVSVIDHIIVGDDNASSFAQLGLI